MTEITFDNFKTMASRTGIVASFNLRVGILTIIGCVAVRPPHDKDLLHILMPLDRRSGEAAVKLLPGIHNELNARAAKLYTAATGIKVSGGTQLPEKTYRPRVGVPAEPAVEDDEAGLRRVIGETMDAAGL